MFTDKDGQVRACTIFRDITERKRMEKNIENAAEEWRTTFDSIEDMIMILDLDYRIVRVNKPVASFLDLSYENILGRYCFDLLHWIKQPPEKCPFAKMRKTKKHEESEMYIDEKEMWISISVDPVFDNDGGIAGAVYIVKNITARKKAEEALRESEERYRIAIENSNDGIAIAREGKHLFVNRRFLEIFGYDRFEDVLKTEKHATVHPDDRERVSRNKPAKNARRAGAGKIRIQGNQRKMAPLLMLRSLSRLLSTLGMLFRLSSYRDVTEQKRAEEILRNSQKDLQTIMDAEPIAISWAGVDRKFQYLNKKFIELFGYTLEEIPTIADWYRVAYPDEAERERAISSAPSVLQAGDPNKASPRTERKITCKDGSVRSVEIMGIFAAGRMVTMFNDITERKQHGGSAAEEREDSFRALVDDCPVAVTWSDMDGNFKYMQS